MNLQEIAFSKYALFACIAAALLLFLILRIVKRLLLRLCKNGTRFNTITSWMPAVEILLWTMFVVWMIEFLSGNNYLYSLALFGLFAIAMAGFMWFSLRDYLAGAIFRINRAFNLNETITTMGITGVIKSFRSRFLELETKKGETIFIPYSKIFGEVINKSHPAEKVQAYTFSMKVHDTDDFKLISEKILIEILNQPYASLSKDPSIYLSQEKDGFMELEITLYSPENKYFPEMQHRIEKVFGVK